MYSVLDAVLLHPLPFPQPDRLVAISAKPWDNAAYPTVLDWGRRTNALEGVAAYTGWSPRIQSSAGLGHADALLVSKNFFSLLGPHFVLGRDFTQTGNEADCLNQAVVTSSYWSRMGGGSSLSGRTLQLDHQIFAIIGVLEPIETGGSLDGSVVITPLSCDSVKALTDRGSSSFQVLARLRPGVSIATAREELSAAQAQLRHDYPNQYPASYVPIPTRFADHEVGDNTRSALFATLAACGTLLLIACANIVNLMLARNARRQAELAIRATLGATSRQLFLQLLFENTSLALLGALCGTALAAWLVQVARRSQTLHLPRLHQATLDPASVAFAVMLTLLIACLLTLASGLRSLRPGLISRINNGSARASQSRGLRRAGRVLVASQLALALAIVASAGWMVSSVFLLLHQPLGFDPSHLLFANVDLRGQSRDLKLNPAKTLAALGATLEELRVIPGITSVAAANDKPLGGRINQYDFCSDLHPEACSQPHTKTPDVFQLTPHYFRTIDQLLLRGRDFNAADDGRAHVAIVNRALAQQEWPGEDPVGHRIFSGQLNSWATVVGEVGDVHSFSLERDPRPNLYLPENDGPDTHMSIMMRIDGNPEALRETVRKVLRQDQRITTNYVRSFPDLMSSQVEMRKLSMQVALAFGAVALLLAVFGTYGLLTYEVSLREREVGIRLALGSTRSAIVRFFVLQESLWIGAGILFGLITAIVVGFLLRAEFFHTRTTSLPVLATATVCLALPALLAVAVPSQRASLLEPSVTLRRE